ncbi:hypothetical protein JCM5296_003993 [Sporobolomyces johnsonii]
MQGSKAYSPSQLELESELDDDSDLDELLTCFPSPPPRRPPLYQLVPPTIVGHASMTSLDGLPEIALPHSPLNARELSEVVLPPTTCASSTSPNALQWETHSSSDGRRGTEIAYLEATRMQASLRKATPPFQRPSGSSKPAEAFSVGRDGGHKTQEKNAAGEARRKRTFGMSHGFRPRRHPSTDKVDEHGWLAGRPIETARGPFSRPDPTPSSLLHSRSSSFGPRSSSLSPPKKKRDARHLRLRNKSVDQFAQAGADNGNEFFDVAQRSLIDVHHSDHGDEDLAAPLRKLSLSDAETTGENQMRRPPPPVSVPRQPLRSSLAAFISVNHTSTSYALPVSLPTPISPILPPSPAAIADSAFVFSPPAPPTPPSARIITERLSPFREVWPNAVLGTQGAFEEGPIGSFASGHDEGTKRSPGRHEWSNESPSTSRLWMDDLLTHYGISADHSPSASFLASTTRSSSSRLPLQQPHFRQVQVPSLSNSYALVRLLRAADPTLNLDDSQTRLLYTRKLPEVAVDALKLRGDAAKAAAAKKSQL